MIVLGDDPALKNGSKPIDTAVGQKKIEELSIKERKQLRLARFGGDTGDQSGPATTIEALERYEELQKKKLERAERFGTITPELNQKKIKARMDRFGIVTKETIEAKRQERMKRFAAMENTASIGLTAEEMEQKRKERMERFGKVEVEEALKSVQKQ